jgi:hypothetical protein
MQLRVLYTKQLGLLEDVGSLRGVESEAVSVSSKINYYKTTKEGRSKIEGSVRDLITVLERKADITNVYVDRSIFTANISVKDSSTFASILTELLEGNIEYLIIQSAYYDAQGEKFFVSLKGGFVHD